MLIATYTLLSDFSLDHPLPESCMAANWNAGRAIASLGKRAVRHSAALRDPSVSVSAVTPRTKAYSTVYEKNVDDQVRPSLVPDDLIPPKSDKYWAPDPQTAVFGPAAEQSAAGESSFPTSPIKGGVESVLEEKAWFRPTSLEDLEKPNHP